MEETLFDDAPLAKVEERGLAEKLFTGMPERTRARSTDPDTSHAAVPQERDPLATETRRRIYALLQRHSLTDEEVAEVAQQEGWFTTPSGMRTRRSELAARGLVVDSGERRKMSTNRKAIVWSSAESGRDAT